MVINAACTKPIVPKQARRRQTNSMHTPRDTKSTGDTDEQTFTPHTTHEHVVALWRGVNLCGVRAHGHTSASTDALVAADVVPS